MNPVYEPVAFVSWEDADGIHEKRVECPQKRIFADPADARKLALGACQALHRPTSRQRSLSFLHGLLHLPSQAYLPVIDWRWKAFPEFSLAELYDVLAARSAVFVVEQQCFYSDIDGLDANAWHLCGYASRAAQPELAAYLRVLMPVGASEERNAEHGDKERGGEHGDEIRIGRVLTNPAYRNTGLGKRLLERALFLIGEQWPHAPLQLHAQAHLQRFYGGFGFEPVSDVHQEDGIAHIWMRRGPVYLTKL